MATATPVASRTPLLAGKLAQAPANAIQKNTGAVFGNGNIAKADTETIVGNGNTFKTAAAADPAPAPIASTKPKPAAPRSKPSTEKRLARVQRLLTEGVPPRPTDDTRSSMVSVRHRRNRNKPFPVLLRECFRDPAIKRLQQKMSAKRYCADNAGLLRAFCYSLVASATRKAAIIADSRRGKQITIPDMVLACKHAMGVKAYPAIIGDSNRAKRTMSSRSNATVYA